MNNEFYAADGLCPHLQVAPTLCGCLFSVALRVDKDKEQGRNTHCQDDGDVGDCKIIAASEGGSWFTQPNFR